MIPLPDWLERDWLAAEVDSFVPLTTPLSFTDDGIVASVQRDKNGSYQGDIQLPV